MAKPKEEKRDHNKSEAEIVHDMKVAAEAKRQRAFVKEVLYPFLMANTKSVDDAKNMLYAAVTGLQQKFNLEVSKEQKRLSVVPVKELDMNSVIQPGEEFNRDRALIELFNNEPVATAESLLAGCRAAIESFEREQATKQALKDLPAELLD